MYVYWTVISRTELGTLLLGACLQLSAYVMLSTGGPFPVMCISFGLIGFSLSLQNAQANGFIGSLKEHTTTKMSLLHASYGETSPTQCSVCEGGTDATLV